MTKARLELETEKRNQTVSSYQYGVEVYHFLLKRLTLKGMPDVAEMLRFAVGLHDRVPANVSTSARYKVAHVAIQTATLIGMKLLGVDAWLTLMKEYDDYKSKVERGVIEPLRD